MFRSGCNNSKKIVPSTKESETNSEHNNSIKTEPFLDELTKMFTLTNGDIQGACYFCNEIKTKSIDKWRKHFQLHCGEDLSSKTIEPNIGLAVFECKQCFAIQATDSNMVQHSLKEHVSQKVAVGAYHRSVKLLPDLNYFVDKCMSRFKYINPAIRYQCGLGNCKYFAYNENSLKIHFKAIHIGNNEPFICSHCSELIASKNTFATIAEHLNLHGENLYECNCNVFESTDQNIIIHIWNEHQNDDFKFRRIERNQTGVMAIEDIFTVLKCNICHEHERFRTVHEILLHFIQMHNSQNMEFIGTYAITRTDRDLKSTSALGDRWLARQLFICSECDNTSVTKSQLYEHHANAHPLKISVQIKYSNISWSEIPLHRHTAQCFYCDYITFSSIHHVYNHWHMAHLNEKPFRFSIAGLAVCGHCHFEGTYQMLKIHFNEQHPAMDCTFVDLINRKMCAICDYIGDDMIEHFRSQHNLSILDNNPIRLSSATFQEALNVNFFAIEQMLIKGNGIIVHMICGCCQENIKPNEYFEHFLKKNRPFVCLSCKFETTNLYAIANHEVIRHNTNVDVVPWITRWIFSWFWLSKIVFNNGFVVSKFNLLNTIFDDSDTFEVIAKALLQQHANDFIITRDNHVDK